VLPSVAAGSVSKSRNVFSQVVLALGSNAAEVHEVVKGGEGADGVATLTIHSRVSAC